jgi:hypothetical protein
LESSGFDGLDTLICNNEGDVVEIVAGCGFEKMAGTDIRGKNGSGRGLCTCADN